MYTKKEFEEQLNTFYSYYKEAIHELTKRSGFTRPTVTKFMEGNTLRSVNQDILIELVIKMNEEAQEKRRSLQQRGRCIMQLELELTENERIGNRKLGHYKGRREQ